MEHYINGFTESGSVLEESTCYVLDTNYLLGALSSVKYSEKYFDAIFKNEGNIYIPFIVWVEFNYNIQGHLSAVQGYLEGTKSFLDSCDEESLKHEKGEIKSKLKNAFDYNIIENNSVGRAIAMDGYKRIDQLVEENEVLNELIENINKETEKIYKSWKDSFRSKMDEKIENHLVITKEFIDKFHDHIRDSSVKIKIGEKYNREKLTEFIEMCRRRVDNDYYPGNSTKDKNKDGVRIWGDLEIPRQYGDILLWLELIEFAQGNPDFQKYVLVSDDVSKNDWVRKGTKKLFPQLSIEFFSKTNGIIEHMKSDEFVEKFSPETSKNELQKDYIAKIEEENSLGASAEDIGIQIFDNFSEYEDEHKNIFKFNDVEVFEEGLDLFDRLESEYMYRDTIVVPAKSRGFAEVFLGENRWHSVKISKDRIPYLKYIAVYQSLPKQEITYVAKIKKIVPSPYETGKSMVIFDGCARQLKRPIPLGEKNSAMQSPRYTNHRKLLTASTVDDLFNFNESDTLFYK